MPTNRHVINKLIRELNSREAKMVSDNAFDNMTNIASRAIIEIRGLESEIERAKKEIATTRRALANQMHLVDDYQKQMHWIMLLLEDIDCNSGDTWQGKLAREGLHILNDKEWLSKKNRDRNEK